MRNNQHFERDFEFSRRTRDRFLIPHLYRPFAEHGILKINDRIRLGEFRGSTRVPPSRADVELHNGAAGVLKIEDKIVRPPPCGSYRCMFFESFIHPRDGLPQRCGILASEADLLVYAFIVNSECLDTYLVPGAPLRAWFRDAE